MMSEQERLEVLSPPATHAPRYKWFPYTFALGPSPETSTQMIGLSYDSSDVLTVRVPRSLVDLTHSGIFLRLAGLALLLALAGGHDSVFHDPSLDTSNYLYYLQD